MLFLALIVMLIDATAKETQRECSSVTFEVFKARVDGKLVLPSGNEVELSTEPQVLVEDSFKNTSHPYLTIQGKINLETFNPESFFILSHPFSSPPSQSNVCSSLELSLNCDFKGTVTVYFSLPGSKITCQVNTRSTRKLSVTPRVQYGKVTAAGTDGSGVGVPTLVSFYESFGDPLVVAMVTTNNGDESVTCRVSNLDSNGFNVFVQPALNGPNKENHPAEEIGYFAVDLSNLPSGMQGGKITLSGRRSYQTVNFSPAYPSEPVLLAFVQTENNPGMITTTIINHNVGSFEIGLDNLETGDSITVSEEVGWIAIPAGEYDFGSKIEFGRTGEEVSDEKFTVKTSYLYSEVPTPVASLNSLYGVDGGYIRGYLSNSNDEVWFHVQEDQVIGEGRIHATEIVSWMAFSTQECYYIQSICQDFCPSGFSLSSKQCLKDSGFVFHLTPHEVKDKVYDNINSIPMSTGEDSSFYPNYKPSDPWAAYMRGYYFTGSSYMTFSGLTLAPHFTLTVWVRPDSGSDTQVLFRKKTGVN